MCDCYFHKCLFCKNELSIHIADFCVPREDIVVICPDCCKPDYEKSEADINIAKYKRLFFGIIEDKNQIDGKLKDGRYRGKLVLILSKNPKTYGICLN